MIPAGSQPQTIIEQPLNCNQELEVNTTLEKILRPITNCERRKTKTAANGRRVRNENVISQELNFKDHELVPEMIGTRTRFMDHPDF